MKPALRTGFTNLERERESETEREWERVSVLVFIHRRPFCLLVTIQIVFNSCPLGGSKLYRACYLLLITDRWITHLLPSDHLVPSPFFYLGLSVLVSKPAPIHWLPLFVFNSSVLIGHVEHSSVPIGWLLRTRGKFLCSHWLITHVTWQPAGIWLEESFSRESGSL